MSDFEVKGGDQTTSESGMARSVTDGKVDYSLVFDGPLVERLAQHLTAALAHYEARNWMKANTAADLERFRASAVRHFIQWLRGDKDEDHFAAAVFNMNGYEYTKERLRELDSIVASVKTLQDSYSQARVEKDLLSSARPRPDHPEVVGKKEPGGPPPPEDALPWDMFFSGNA